MRKVLFFEKEKKYSFKSNDVTVVQTNIHNGEIMHITGGKLRRRSVSVADKKGVRPTSAKVREAVFSMIGQDLNGISFLDCFGGSGIMGMEAWSRGANPVKITEKNTRSIAQIRKQLDAFQAGISLQCIDAIKGMTGEWDVVFLDPPYQYDIHPFVEKAFEVSTWLIITETKKTALPNPERLQVPMSKGDWSIWKQKHYGASTITIFRRYTSSLDSA